MPAVGLARPSLSSSPVTRPAAGGRRQKRQAPPPRACAIDRGGGADVTVRRQPSAPRDCAHRAPVPPVETGVRRPRWSVMIPTYNCAGYLETALRGVLAQAPGPERIQIEVVDDHSTADDPEEVVRRVGD